MNSCRRARHLNKGGPTHKYMGHLHAHLLLRFAEIPIPRDSYTFRSTGSGEEGGGEPAREARPNAREEEAAGGEEQTSGWTAGGG